MQPLTDQRPFLQQVGHQSQEMPESYQASEVKEASERLGGFR
jgi:hypothetical protein